MGELLWYLTKDNSLDFIKPFVPRYEEESTDGITVYGGYGPRLFQHKGQDQISNVIELLRKRSDSRRAVIQIFDAQDLAEDRPEIPCTTTLQFLVRKNELHLIATMRSNDAYWGFPHDVFCFTMLQEIVARSLDLEIGPYRHFVGSMHIYDEFRDDAQRLIQEGYQRRIEMPAMPFGDPWPAIRSTLAALDKIRKNEDVDLSDFGDNQYWADLVRLLQIFAATGDQKAIAEIRDNMSSDSYHPYIDTRINMTRKQDRFGQANEHQNNGN
ncbi:MAG: thymidylate synthase [Pseudomonadota bacterium]